MALIVQKFGGTSVLDTDRIKNVASRVGKHRLRGDRVVVVVSAMGGVTDNLIRLAGEINPMPSEREMDMLLATGEQTTISLLAMALHSLDLPAVSLTGAQAGIVTDGVHSKAKIQNITPKQVHAMLDEGNVVIVAGFQGQTPDGRITTLGRGGSDLTAIAMAAALKADLCQIYTDVDGVYTTDPRVVDSARRLERITFEEMLEMASLGSKVLQIRAVEFAGKYNVPLRVLSSFAEGEGTLITFEDENAMEQPVVSGIAFNRDEAKLTISGVPDTPGSALRILKPVSDANIEVDMIVQNVGEDNKTAFTFTVHRNDFKRAQDVLRGISTEIGAGEVGGDTKIAKVSIVGVGMRSHAGVATKMFEALSNEGINIQMISTSEIKISVVIDEKYLELAVRALHSAFELDKSGVVEEGM
ncbi:aspartate kinase [uncultured Marinobacter sp.]|uniref:aspartate kinase n=1 Tax=uncultured Marinobacter sp. TaxID=187379 RepID=UPI002586324B|nr:aspartate kinase [uncultured Marinobacter sp.]